MTARDAAARVKRHADGTFYVRPYLGTDRVTGARVRPYHRLSADNVKDAMAEAAAWIDSYLGRETVSDALGSYVATCESMGRAENTVRSYRSLARNYVAPTLGRADLRDVTTSDLVALYRMLLERGGESGRPLSPTSVLEVHWFLRGAFSWFCRMGWRSSNPAATADKPSRRPSRARALDASELSSVESALREGMGQGSDAFLRCSCLLAFVALRTGVRCGEACALRRRDVRAATSDIAVCGTVVEGPRGAVRRDGTKRSGARTVAVDRSVLEACARHMGWESLAVGASGPDDPLATPDGSFMRPGSVARSFSSLARSAGVEWGARFHSLRHTHATWLLSSGVDAKTVADRLGHSTPTVTLGTYAHAMPGMDAGAAEAFAAAVMAGRG